MHNYHTMAFFDYIQALFEVENLETEPKPLRFVVS